MSEERTIRAASAALTRDELKNQLKALERSSQKSNETRPRLALGLAVIDEVLEGGLETGRLHEISGTAPGDAAACGFATHLLAAFSARGPVIWILPRRATLYAPGLAGLGLHPRRLLVVEARDRAMRLWALAEALRWEDAAAVLAEIDPVDFNISRRLQLAAAASGVTGLLLHDGAHAAGTATAAERPAQASAARTRWRVSAAQSTPVRELATAGGLGPPRWRLELRRGPAARRGTWLVEQSNEGLIHVQTADLERAHPAEPRRQQHGAAVISGPERAGPRLLAHAALGDAGRDADALPVAAASRHRSRLARGR